MNRNSDNIRLRMQHYLSSRAILLNCKCATDSVQVRHPIFLLKPFILKYRTNVLTSPLFIDWNVAWQFVFLVLQVEYDDLCWPNWRNVSNCWSTVNTGPTPINDNPHNLYRTELWFFSTLQSVWIVVHRGGPTLKVDQQLNEFLVIEV